MTFHKSSCEACGAYPFTASRDTGHNPFQMVVADMFQPEGHMYMAYADRLTGWLVLTPCFIPMDQDSVATLFHKVGFPGVNLNG